MSDGGTSLIQGLKNGDRTAWSQLIDNYGNLLHYWALQWCNKNNEDAEDLVQETLVKAMKPGALNRIQDDDFDHLKRWLRTVMYHKWVEKNRKPRAKQEPGHDGSPIIVDPSGTPPDQAIADERREVVRAALELLTYEQREVVVLRVFEGMTFKEIAASLKVPMGTAVSRYYNALKQLRNLLGPPGD